MGHWLLPLSSESSMFHYFCLSSSPTLVTKPLYFESRFDAPEENDTFEGLHLFFFFLLISKAGERP